MSRGESIYFALWEIFILKMSQLEYEKTENESEARFLCHHKHLSSDVWVQCLNDADVLSFDRNDDDEAHECRMC